MPYLDPTALMSNATVDWHGTPPPPEVRPMMEKWLTGGLIRGEGFDTSEAPVEAPAPTQRITASEPSGVVGSTPGLSNRIVQRLANAGVSLDEFKALPGAEQQSLLDQLFAAEQQAMIQGFDAAKLGGANA